MSSHQRVKKPKLARTQPIRSWSMLFGVPTSEKAEAGASPAAGGEGSPSLQDVVSRSVDLGYRVIDDYIRRGQRAAQRISDRSYGADSATNDFQELSVRMAQYASDFASLWFELMQVAAGNAVRPPAGLGDAFRVAPVAGTSAAAAPPRAAPAPPAPPVGEPARVQIEVASKHPTEVSLDLQPHATAGPLVIHALRAVDPAKPRLTDVSFRAAADGEPARLRVRVPDDHPPGIYNGLIVDTESNRPVGTLSVRITAD